MKYFLRITLFVMSIFLIFNCDNSATDEQVDYDVSFTGKWEYAFFWGDDSSEYIEGSKKDDYIWGYGGSDHIFGKGGVDTISGGPGDDVIYGGNKGDNIGGDEDDDEIYGENGDDNLHGGDGNDTLEGGDDDDELHGGDGNDKLYGGDDDDILEGGDGNDKLYGEEGDDTFIVYPSGGTKKIYMCVGREDVLLDLDPPFPYLADKSVTVTVQKEPGYFAGDKTLKIVYYKYLNIMVTMAWRGDDRIIYVYKNEILKYRVTIKDYKEDKWIKIVNPY